MKKPHHKFFSAFTLLELCLCLVILSLISGLIANRAFGFIHHYRFERDVKQFAIDLDQLQLLAISYNTDITLNLFVKEEGLVYQAYSHEPKLNLDQFKKINLLSEVHSYSFNQFQQRQYSFNIFSDGRIDPPGILEFIPAQKNVLSRYIDFSQPICIKMRSEYPKQQKKVWYPSIEEIGIKS